MKGVFETRRGEIGYVLIVSDDQNILLTKPTEENVLEALSQFKHQIDITAAMDMVQTRDPSIYGIVFDIEKMDPPK